MGGGPFFGMSLGDSSALCSVALAAKELGAKLVLPLAQRCLMREDAIAAKGLQHIKLNQLLTHTDSVWQGPLLASFPIFKSLPILKKLIKAVVDIVINPMLR